MASFELDGFEPIKRIGGGGFGDVWLARQTNVDREVAVKVGHAPIQDEIIKLRFDRECKALGRLSGHPNILDVYTAGTLDDGRPYLVLEYIDGGTLWQQLKRHAIDESVLLSVGEQLASALHEAHSSGVLHRDLKPENILMRSTGEAVLGDFGIARLQDGANTTSAAITASVAYAAPEVLGGKKASVASDIYGIGICLLAAILRSVPFVDKDDKSIHPIISRVMSEQPPELRGRGISDRTADLVAELLHKDPARRPADAATVQRLFADLRSALPSPGLRDDTGVPRWSSSVRNSVGSPPGGESSGGTGRSTMFPELGRRNPAGQARRPSAAGTGGDAGPSSNGPSKSAGQSGERSSDLGLAASVGLGAAALPSARRSRTRAAYGLAVDGDDPDPTRFSESAKSFALAYLATLAVGIIILFIVAQLLG